MILSLSVLRFGPSAGCMASSEVSLASLVAQLGERSSPRVTRWLVTLHTLWPAPEEPMGWLISGLREELWSSGWSANRSYRGQVPVVNGQGVRGLK